MRVCRRSSTTICIVFNYDAGSSIKRCTPLCIDIQFLGDPETIGIGIGFWINEVTVDVICICHINRFVVICRDIIFIDDKCITIEYLRARFIQIPANKLIACESAGRLTDMSAFTDTECHRLIGSSPVNISGCARRIIRMQEHTILLLPPFCINGYAAFRHCRKCIQLCAFTVYIPAFKYISFRRCSRLVIII